jgi:hypothetical protein
MDPRRSGTRDRDQSTSRPAAGLDYWTQAGQTAIVSVSILVDNQKVEYWLESQIHPIADEQLERYLVHLRAQWLAKLSMCSACAIKETRFAFGFLVAIKLKHG